MAPRKSAASSAVAASLASSQVAEEPQSQNGDVVNDEASGGKPKALAFKIDILQEHGINAADTKKLREAGICTVEALQQATKKEVLEVKGITEARLTALVEAASKVTVAHSGKFKTASQLKEEQATLFHVSTGSKEFDALLGGGLQSKYITEVYGEYRTGKTQLCATAAVTAQLDPNNGGKVVYVDTEGNFSPERLRGVCERFGVSLEGALENILVARVYNTDQQEAVPQLIEAQIDADGAPYALIIIDSLTALWRVDFSGRGELSERQQRLGRHLNQIRKLAERHNMAVLVSNGVMSDPSGGGLSFVPDPKKPIGGHVVAHAANVRVSLRKGRDQERVAKLVDHPCMPEADATFVLGPGGVGDA